MASHNFRFADFFKSSIKFIKSIWNDWRQVGFKQQLRRDLNDIYQFYIDDETRTQLSAMNRFQRWIYLIVLVLRNVILKLTPARRILLLLSMFMIYFSGHLGQSNSLQIGFMILLFILILELKDKLLAFDELREARNLQLSMLPKTPPEHPDIDMAFFMSTANEVGGDYYDFQQMEDGTLIVAAGDVTGHGMKAGVVVAAMKSLFKALGTNHDISGFFNKCTQILKSMNLEYLYMAMTLIRIKNRMMTSSVAGMPPILFYRPGTETVEEISKGGVALGFIECEYQRTEMKLEPGDTILLMTDGFPELFNDKEEMLDYPRIKECFKEFAHLRPEEIIEQLCSTGEKWRNEKPQDDDISFVVLQVKR